MSNPWAKSFEELRAPYLAEKKAKKDYDGDGKIESGTDEYMGSKDKAIKKAMAERGKKKVAEHHQKDADGNIIPHEDEADGTPSSVEEMVDKKFGSSDKVNLDKAIKNIQSGNVKKIEKKVKKLTDEYVDEAKIDKIDPKNKRKRRNEVSFGKQTKPYDPPTKSYKNEMGKFLQKQRKQKHDKSRGTTYKRPTMKQDLTKSELRKMGEEVVSEADKKGKGSGSKDACYHKVKSRYSVWPSAYASGALVKCRKAGAKNWGNSSKKEEFDYYQMPMKSFRDMVGECWKTHERVPGTVKGAKGSCRPKGSAKMKEDHTPGNAEYDSIVKKIKDPKTPQEVKVGLDAGLTQGGHSSVLQTMMKDKKIKEAVKNPKLDIKETGVKNKIEINPEIKTEAANAPVKK